MERVYKRDGILFKILPCLLFALFAIMCLYGSNVYATVDFTYNDTNYSVQDYNERNNNESYSKTAYMICEHLYLDNSHTDETVLYILNQDVADYSNVRFDTSYVSNPNIGAREYRVYGEDTNGDTVWLQSWNQYSPYSQYLLKDGSWVLNANCTSFGTNFVTTDKIVASSHNVYDKDNNLVFQAPPQGQPTIVATQVEGVEMNKVIQEILGILPVVLVVIVGLLAIRKGIQIILTFLRKS